jgi:hypothetical protein
MLQQCLANHIRLQAAHYFGDDQVQSTLCELLGTKLFADSVQRPVLLEKRSESVEEQRETTGRLTRERRLDVHEVWPSLT